MATQQVESYTESNDANDAPPNQGAKGEKGKKPPSKAKRARDTIRAEKKRVSENTKTIAARDDDITKKYRLTDAPALEAILQQELKYRKQIQTSTRGVGVAVAATVASLAQLKTPPPPATVPVLELYRVSLALLQEKMSRVYSECCSSLMNTQEIRQFYDDPSRTAALATIERLPKCISGYIDHLGEFTHDSQGYVPVGQPDRYYEGNFVPGAGRVYLENLRKVVEYLADPNSTAPVRRRFITSNPIPGAVYEGNLLTAASRDAIMPDGYDDMSLRRDVRAVNNFMSSIAKQASTWIGPPPCLKTSHGSPAILATTHAVIRVNQSLVPEMLYRNDGLEGVGDAMYWADVNLKPFEWAVGAIGLFREPPIAARDLYPFWDGSSERMATRHVQLNIVDCLRLVYQMSW